MNPLTLQRQPLLLRRILPHHPSFRQTISPNWRRSLSDSSRSARNASSSSSSSSKPSPSASPRPQRVSPPFRTSPFLRSIRNHSSKPSPPQRPHPNPNPTADPPLTLSQRLKKLSREYGWSALGVYLLLSAVDFPFCFLAVRMLGTDRIGRYEHAVIEAFWRVVGTVWPPPDARPRPEMEMETEAAAAAAAAAGGGAAAAQREGSALGWSGEVKEAQAKSKSSEATLWTQLALAYAIHKSFIFIRVPLTAAVTPKVVKVLRGWGWNIGKRTPKGATPPRKD